MLYLIGLGLNEKGISKSGLELAKRCKKIYLEIYTVDFPYAYSEITELIGKKISLADRSFIESLKIIDEAKKTDIALLIYGNPLMATTHIALIQEAKRSRVKYRIIHNASILDGIAETGLQAYKFGKTASIPAWKKNYEPTSFIKTIKENLSIGAHTLLLVDIGLDFKDCLRELKEAAKRERMQIGKIITCQCIGTPRSKIFYRHIQNFGEDEWLKKPYCLIIPAKLHFVEEEFLKDFEE